MSGRLSYHVVPVVPRKRGAWRVLLAGTAIECSRHATQAAAVAAAKELAKAAELGQVVVHRVSGEFLTEHTYPRSSDPRRHSG